MKRNAWDQVFKLWMSTSFLSYAFIHYISPLKCWKSYEAHDSRSNLSMPWPGLSSRASISLHARRPGKIPGSGGDVPSVLYSMKSNPMSRLWASTLCLTTWVIKCESLLAASVQHFSGHIPASQNTCLATQLGRLAAAWPTLVPRLALRVWILKSTLRRHGGACAWSCCAPKDQPIICRWYVGFITVSLLGLPHRISFEVLWVWHLRNIFLGLASLGLFFTLVLQAHRW